MTELLFPGAEVYVAHTAREDRKTQYDLALVKNGQTLVSVDSRVANKLVKKALSARALNPFKDYEHLHAEPVVKKGRLDFLLTGKDLTPCYLEVKSCTLVIDNIAMFPDAPTVRGARHLGELIEFKKEGFRSCVVFIIQHPDAKVFSPNEKTDPFFAKGFYRALNNGVEIYSYKCNITTKAISINESVSIGQLS
jgi:sugar fermentation stimulation protein A